MLYNLLKKTYNICLSGIDNKDSYYNKRYKNKLLLNTIKKYKLIKTKKIIFLTFFKMTIIISYFNRDQEPSFFPSSSCQVLFQRKMTKY